MTARRVLLVAACAAAASPALAWVAAVAWGRWIDAHPLPDLRVCLRDGYQSPCPGAPCVPGCEYRADASSAADWTPLP